MEQKPKKVCEMTGVREYAEEYPVEVWMDENGRLVVRAYNEGKHNVTEIDLLDLRNWLAANPDVARAA